MENLDTKVIPLPTERECTVVLGADGEETHHLWARCH